MGGVGNGDAEEDWCWGSRRDLAGQERGERILAGGPVEGTTWVWIKKWRSQQQHR